MRGMKSTLALLVVLVGLGAYIYFYGDRTSNSSDVEKLFTGLASDDIETLTVKNDAGETTSVKKQDGKWMMTAPFQTRASDMDASGIANALAGLDVTRVVEEAPADVKDYGLDTPSIEIAFTSPAGKPSGKLLIGTKTATGGSLYARKEGETRVVLIGEYNSATFNKSTFDLRDKAIVSFDRSKVDGIDVVQPTGSFELAKKDGTWTLAKPLMARADGTAADGLVTAMESLQMKSIVVPSATPEALEKYGLATPSTVVNLHLGADRTSVAVGAPAGDDTVYAKDVSRPDVFTIQLPAADDLRKTMEDYRARDLFDMRAFTANRIELTRNGKTTVFEKVKGADENAADVWKKVSPVAADADKEKFPAFVAALADIRAMSFVDSKTRTGLDAPAATIVVKFDDGKKEDRVQIAKPARPPTPRDRTTPRWRRSTARNSTKPSPRSTSSRSDTTADSSRPRTRLDAGVPQWHAGLRALLPSSRFDPPGRPCRRLASPRRRHPGRPGHRRRDVRRRGTIAFNRRHAGGSERPPAADAGLHHEDVDAGGSCRSTGVGLHLRHHRDHDGRGEQWRARRRPGRRRVRGSKL